MCISEADRSREPGLSKQLDQSLFRAAMLLKELRIHGGCDIQLIVFDTNGSHVTHAGNPHLDFARLVPGVSRGAGQDGSETNSRVADDAGMNLWEMLHTRMIEAIADEYDIGLDDLAGGVSVHTRIAAVNLRMCLEG